MGKLDLSVLRYPLLTGILLGVLQTGLFFQLSFTLSSGFGTYLLITLSWLLGSFIGVTVIVSTKVHLYVLLVISLISYGVCSAMPLIFPFNTSLWWIYGILIIGVGVFPGVFFARVASRYTAAQLFLWENNGFVVGMVIGTLLFLVLGRYVLWVMPVFMALMLVMFKGRQSSAQTVTGEVHRS